MKNSLYHLCPLEKPQARIVGHRDLPDVHKDCPCFDACTEYADI
jgi:hypothetical protein